MFPSGFWSVQDCRMVQLVSLTLEMKGLCECSSEIPSVLALLYCVMAEGEKVKKSGASEKMNIKPPWGL